MHPLFTETGSSRIFSAMERSVLFNTLHSYRWLSRAIAWRERRENIHRGRERGEVKGRSSMGVAGWVRRPLGGGLHFAGITSLSIDNAQGKWNILIHTIMDTQPSHRLLSYIQCSFRATLWLFPTHFPKTSSRSPCQGTYKEISFPPFLAPDPHQDVPLSNAADPGNQEQKDILQTFQSLPCLRLLHLALRTAQVQ